MSDKTDKITFVLNQDTESEPPPCGCAIGDLLAMQTESDLPLPDGTIDVQFKKQTEVDLPPCGCAIGNLLEMQVNTNSAPCDGNTQD